MKIKTVLTLAFCFLLPVLVYGAERARTNDDDLYHACCRVRCGNVAGSGCIFQEDEDGNLYVLTNYHVAGKRDCELDFVIDGRVKTVKGQNVWYGYNERYSLDAVVLCVSRSSIADVDDALRFVPLYMDGELNGEERMVTAGAPSAQYPKKLEGRIQFNGGQNATFYPTPYGGQSGSSIFIKRNGKYYVGALLTWRQAEEGSESFGGLAQPITRVVSAMRGETAIEPCKLPSNAIECPKDVEKGSIILGDGTIAIPCADELPEVYLECWSIAGCQACELAKKQWLSKFDKKEIVAYFRGDGAEREYAQALGITSYPTFRLIHNGCEDGRWVGYFKAVAEQIEAKISLIKKEEKARRDQAQLDEDIAKFQGRGVDPSCGRFSLLRNYNEGRGTENKAGRFSLLPEPKDEEEKGGGEERGQEQEQEQPRRLLPRIEKKLDDKKDEYLGEIERKIGDKKNEYLGEIKDRLRGMTMSVFLLCYSACVLALLTYKTLGALLSGLWTFLKSRVFNFNRLVADAIVSQLDNTKDTKKDK